MANELILIVEDNPKNLKLVRDILQVTGYQTVEAETGEEGVRLARERQPALILMDIQLPGMSGIEALGRLRADAATRTIPVIAVTASVMAQDRERVMAAGFDGFQGKPIRVRELLATVGGSWRNHEHVAVISRRTYLGVLALALLAAPLAAGAQPGGAYRIGWLDYSSSGESVGIFVQALVARGWSEGGAFTIEYRGAEGRIEQLSKVAADLVRLPVDVIVAPGYVGGSRRKERDRFDSDRHDRRR